MEKRAIERFTLSLMLTVIVLFVVGVLFFSADQMFGWDIFSPQMEKVVGFILFSLGLIFVATVVVNIVVNIGIIAGGASRLLSGEARRETK